MDNPFNLSFASLLTAGSKPSIVYFYYKNGWRARWDLNPGPPAPQAGVIIRTRRRAPKIDYESQDDNDINFLNMKFLVHGTA